MDVATLLSYTRMEGECLVYTRSLNPDGYGRVRGDKAHRVMYRLVHGDIPGGLKVLHSCDTPPCINPWHLWAGTQADNIADAALKDRLNVKGERSGRARLTTEQVLYIRSCFINGKAPYGTMTRLASEFDVDKNTINFIKRGLSWKHLSLTGKE